MGAEGGEDLMIGIITPVDNAPLPRCPSKRG